MVAGLALSACGGDDADEADSDNADSAPAEPADAPADTEAPSGTEPDTDQPAEEPAGSEALSGELRWAVRENLAGPAQTMVDAFEAAHPDVNIELEQLPAPPPEYIQRLVTARLGEDLPDLIMTGDQYVSVLAEAEITADLRPYLESSEVLDVDYFAPNFLDAFIPKTGAHEGEIISLPQSADAVVVFYNKDHFDEVGLDYPADDWTYEDFVAAAEALSTDERWGAYERADFSPRYNAMTVALGGSIASDDYTEARLDSPEAIEAFRMMLEPMKDGPFVPREEMATIRYDDAFIQQRASMFTGVRANVPAVRAGASFNWDVAPAPTVDGVRKSGSGSIGIGMTQAASNPDLAWAFLEWFFSEDGGVPVLTETYAVVPAVPSLFDSPTWRDLPAPPGNVDVFVEAIETGQPNPRLPYTAWSSYNDAVNTAIDSILLAGASYEDAFAEANQTAQQALDEANAEG
ncbi:carbohydrate ABC transporter substrate-binding protein (CUT1 family) [Ilumatobacter fluminis]|uniref:Carbohydrate ABC transporter substrate-binding protein (CUT1 family) n=1 Tax=Ilumatobacter fluminis TaxID=467091 RepID=A0A4R7HVN4_9ACTN|nr:carbohydrate ABC transporter substrate-binding protein (CUT1 family) [Ilumatobacter fluminis]